MIEFFLERKVGDFMFLILNSWSVTGFQYKNHNHPIDILYLENSKEINERWIGHDAFSSMELMHDLFLLVHILGTYL